MPAGPVCSPIPLEVVKTRMQLQGELRAPGPTNGTTEMSSMPSSPSAKVDLLAALQKGLAPALLYQFLMNGIRLGTYGLVEAGEACIQLLHAQLPGSQRLCWGLGWGHGSHLGSPIYMVRRRVLPGAFQEDPCRVVPGPSPRLEVDLCREDERFD